MYKERIKSSVNPIIATLIWLGATYLFTIVWGILQILFEFQLELAKYLVCIIETVWFGWFLINRVLTEYEAEIVSGKMRITKMGLVGAYHLMVYTNDKEKTGGSVLEKHNVINW